MTAIGARADPQRGTVEITIRPNSAPTWLRSGLTVDANIILARQEKRLLIPTTAVLLRGDRALALVIEDRRVRERRIVVGQSSTQGTVVLSGLTEEDWVVLESASVEPGQAARPVAPERGRWPGAL